MAFQSSRMPLGPSMRDKNEHASSATRKFTSSLRIPDDTTWPKIPERKLHENIENIKAPCIVTLKGKPQKNQTIVQLPHSQFIKAAPKNDETEQANLINTSATLQTSVKERHLCNNRIKESKLKTAITTQVTSPDILNEDQNKSNEQSQKDVIEKLDYVTNEGNMRTKNNYRINSSIKTNNSIAETLNPSDTLTQEGDSILDKFKNSNKDYSKNCGELKIFNDYQNITNFVNDVESYTTSEYQRKPEKLRPCQLRMSDTTDSEIYSSDTIKTCQRQKLKIRGSQKRLSLESRDYNNHARKCYRSIPKLQRKKNETDLCSYTHCRKSWNSKKRTHHSEPIINSSSIRQRCLTAHGKTLPCCRKNYHRAASDSDCMSLIQTRCEYHRETMGGPQMKKRKSDIEHFISCNTDILPIFSRMSDQGLNHSNEATKTMRCNYEKPGNGNILTTKDVATTAGAIANADTIETSTLPMCSSCVYINNPREDKQTDSRLLKLKTAVLFGCIIYALILFSPTLYDYFFYEEEQDTYEDLSSVELVLEYIVSSFQEAFGGLIELMSKIFFQSRTCRKCNNVN